VPRGNRLCHTKDEEFSFWRNLSFAQLVQIVIHMRVEVLIVAAFD
jgi:hypothetical protein